MTPTPSGPQGQISRIAVLDQPIRRSLYDLLDETDWLSRDDAAAALEIPRSVAAFHLDKLAEVDLVEVRFERTGTKRGPGAGRPTKLYRLAQDELSVSLPERHYDLAGSVLAAAVAESARTGEPVADSLRHAAHSAGAELGALARDAVSEAKRSKDRRQAVVDTLAAHGYEPQIERRKEIALANCPFHRLAEQHRDLVCGMNLDFLTGLLAGLDGSDLDARLDPHPGYCCVRITVG